MLGELRKVNSPSSFFFLNKYFSNAIDKIFFSAIILMCCFSKHLKQEKFSSFAQHNINADKIRPEFVRRKSEVDNGNTDGNCRSTYCFYTNMFLDMHNLRS